MSIAQKPPLDIQEIYRLIDAGYSQGAVSRQLHCSQGYVSKLLKARAQPVHSRAQRRNDLELWCQTVDVEIDTLKAEIDTLKALVSVPHLNGAHPVHSRAHPQPSKSRGIRLPGDLWDALDAHTQTTGQSITDILVPLLDTFFAGQEVHDA